MSEKHECGKVSMKRGRLRSSIAELKEKRNLGDVELNIQTLKKQIHLKNTSWTTRIGITYESS